MTTFADNRSSAPMDRLEAAHILLGVSPKTVIAPFSNVGSELPRSMLELKQKSSIELSLSRGGGLDALATLAISSLEKNPSSPSIMALRNFSNTVSSGSSSSDDDSEAMPPPPPRRRIRSCSNPEGMEKWDSLGNGLHNRARFVIPSSILEEELAEAKAATERKQEEEISAQKKNFRTDEVTLTKELTPGELLRKARSRLLEDLSEGSISGQKGELTLPHSLAKYKNVYNKNGRIGIYTPAERAAIISRFQSKRARRVWNKKIRYNCRKNLADRRLRVKGRFVKRSELPIPPKPLDDDMPDVNDPEAGFSPTPDQPFRRLRRHTIT